MLRDALLRVIQAAETRARAILAHALHDKTGAFCKERGFTASLFTPLVFFLVSCACGAMQNSSSGSFFHTARQERRMPGNFVASSPSFRGTEDASLNLIKDMPPCLFPNRSLRK